MGTEAEHFINLLSPYIHAYGYWVAFFGIMLENAGIPVPAETTLVILSFFASQGALKIWLVIPIAVLGDTIGDNIGFLIGRTGGRRVVEKIGPYVRLNKERLEAMEALFREKGGRTVFTAHFFSTTRFLAALTAGVSHMPYRKFVAVNAAAAAVFVTLVAGTSYYFGANLDATLRFFHLFRLAGLIIAVVLVTGYLYHFYLRRRHLVRRLGLKIISVAAAASLVFGLAIYAVAGALIVLPRAGRHAGELAGTAGGVDFSVEHGFISDIEGNSVIITALGEPVITLTGRADLNVTVRNIRAPETAVSASGGGVEAPIALDDLTLNFIAAPRGKSVVRLHPRRAAKGFTWAAAGDTRDWGPVFAALVESINEKRPAFVFHAGDFVEDGDKRDYRSFLAGISYLDVPLYTTPGERELRDHGGRTYAELFGPRDYGFSYRGSFFISLDTSGPLREDVLAWLAGELKKAGGRNVFIVTYRAPVDDAGFMRLVSKNNVKAVYSVKTGGVYRPGTGGVRYFRLGRVPNKGHSYELTRVEGGDVSFEEVAVVPKRLTAFQRMVLSYEDLKRRLSDYLR